MGTLPLPTRQGAPAVQDPVASSINPASDAALAGLPGGVPAATHVCTAWSRAPGPRKVQQGAAAEAPVLAVHSPAPALARGLAVPRLHARPHPRRQPRAAPGLPAPGEERGGRTDSWAGRRRGDVWRGSIPEHRGARCAQPEMGGRWGAGEPATVVGPRTSAHVGRPARSGGFAASSGGSSQAGKTPPCPGQPPSAPSCQAIRRRGFQ